MKPKFKKKKRKNVKVLKSWKGIFLGFRLIDKNINQLFEWKS